MRWNTIWNFDYSLHRILYHSLATTFKFKWARTKTEKFSTKFRDQSEKSDSILLKDFALDSTNAKIVSICVKLSSSEIYPSRIDDDYLKTARTSDEEIFNVKNADKRKIINVFFELTLRTLTCTSTVNKWSLTQWDDRKVHVVRIFDRLMTINIEKHSRKLFRS